MANVDMKALLEAGVHFGHRTQKWNPRMKQYIFTERNGIHIIDLQQTVKALEDAYKVVRNLVADGGTVLFVGTKRQATETIEAEAQRCEMPYVTVRWLGGMLTNWRTMRDRINDLDRLERMKGAGEFERLTKKEGLMMSRKIDKLELRFGGIRTLHRLPDMLFVVDVRREETAVREANILDIPIVALVDTNCDPRVIDHVIPSNDDAIRAIKLLVAYIADAVIEGKSMRKEEEPEAAVAEGKVDLVIEELSDEDLLGKATLQKVTAQAEADAEAAIKEVEFKETKEAEKTEEAEEAEEAAKTEEAAEAEEETEAVAEAVSETEAPKEEPKAEKKPAKAKKAAPKKKEKAAEAEEKK
jgi:small subunit ribosomal protein S2